MDEYSERQLEIISAAVEIIAEKGIQNLTIKNLSSFIGISEAALYRHFNSKVDILEGVLDNFGRESRSQIAEIFESDYEVVEKIGMVLNHHFKRFAESPALAAVVFSEGIFQDSERLSEKILRIMNKTQGALLEIVNSEKDRNTLRDDIPREHIVLLIVGALRFHVNKWYLSGYGFDLVEEGNQVWESLRKLITK